MAATVYFKPDLIDTVKEVINDKLIFDRAMFLSLEEDDVDQVIKMIDNGRILKSVVISFRQPSIQWSQYCSSKGLEPTWQMRGVKIAKKNKAGNLFGVKDETFYAYNIGDDMDLPSVVDIIERCGVDPFTNSVYEMEKVDTGTLDVFRSWCNLFDEPIEKGSANDVLVGSRQGYLFEYKGSKYYFDVNDLYAPYFNNKSLLAQRFWSKYYFLVDCSTLKGDNTFVYKKTGEGKVLPTIFKNMDRYLTLTCDPSNGLAEEATPWIV